jgi:hypothetical protein
MTQNNFLGLRATFVCNVHIQDESVCIRMYMCMYVYVMCSFAYDRNCIVNNAYHHAKAVPKHVVSSSITLNALRSIRLSLVLLYT